MTPKELFAATAKEMRQNDPLKYFTELRLYGTRSEILEELRILFEACTPREVLEHARDDEGDVPVLKVFMAEAARQLRLAIDQLMMYLELENKTGKPPVEATPESPYESVRKLQRMKDEKVNKTDIVYHANRMQALALTDTIRDDGVEENEAIKKFLRALF